MSLLDRAPCPIKPSRSALSRVTLVAIFLLFLSISTLAMAEDLANRQLDTSGTRPEQAEHQKTGK
jgi:hypothetical protein